MAEFARKHGAALGRIEMVRIVQDRIERLCMHVEAKKKRYLVNETEFDLDGLKAHLMKRVQRIADLE